MSDPPVVGAARSPSTSRAAVPLARRGDGAPPSRFHRGTHPPYAIRWFGSTALLGHLRRVSASIVASQAVDTRDWMRPERPHGLLAHAARVLRAPGADAPTLVERLGRPLWIDFVSDTGDDRDVSAAVARLVFTEYAPAARLAAFQTSSYMVARSASEDRLFSHEQARRFALAYAGLTLLGPALAVPYWRLLGLL